MGAGRLSHPGRAVSLALVLLAASAASARPAEAGPGGAAAGAFVLRTPAVASDGGDGSTFDPGVAPSGVRYCRFLPGASRPAQLAPAPPQFAPPPSPEPPNTPVPAETTAAQMAIFNDLWATVDELYVDPAFNGVDWDGVYDRYAAKVAAGLTEENFAALMKRMIQELHDEHSSYQTAAEVQEEERRVAEGLNFVGIGASFLPVGDAGSVLYVLPGSPAALAGILPHDLLVSVDGGPLRDAAGRARTLGEAGTPVTVQVRRGGALITFNLVRAAVSAPVPVDSCLVAGTRIGYIFLPTFFDASITEQVRSALQKLMAGGPLDGLIIDNRVNGGGLESQAKGVLSFFTSGNHGAYVSRTGSTPFSVTAQEVGNSQTVPLVVLIGQGTASYGEIFSGVLRASGEAKTVGLTTKGNVELLNSTSFSDGSRVWLARQTFQPVGLPAGAWEDSGIAADFVVHGQWHEFTEVDDPAFARAIAILSE